MLRSYDYYRLVEAFVQTENCRQLTHPLIRHFIYSFDDIIIRHLVMHSSFQIKSVIATAVFVLHVFRIEQYGVECTHMPP